MPLVEESRFYPAAPDETYRGLVQAVRELTDPKAFDDFSRAVVFTTRETARTSGTDLLAYVVPGDGGSHVRMAEQAAADRPAGAESNQVTALLDRTSELIGYARDQRPSGPLRFERLR